MEIFFHLGELLFAVKLMFKQGKITIEEEFLFSGDCFEKFNCREIHVGNYFVKRENIFQICTVLE